MTPQILAQGAEADAYAQGVQAYVWGYPLVRMERVARQYTDVPANNPPTSYRAPLNQIGWARELATAASKDMPTSNNDTFYMSAIVDLTEPFILTVPDTHDRYYVVDVFNMWQELEHYIGRRVTGTGPGKFALVPPGWKGELPAGVTRLDVATDKSGFGDGCGSPRARTSAPVLALQREFRLVPLSAYGKAEAKPQTAALSPLPDIANDELGFFTQLGAAVKANPIRPADEALFAQFARIGLTKDGFDRVETGRGPAQGSAARSSGRAVGRDLGLPDSGGAAQRLGVGDRAGRFRLRLSAARARLGSLSRRPGREGGDVPASLCRFRRQGADRRRRDAPTRSNSPQPRRSTPSGR